MDRRGRRPRGAGGRHRAAGCGRAVGLDARRPVTGMCSEAHAAGTRELLQVQAGHRHRRGRRPVGHARDGRRRRVPRRCRRTPTPTRATGRHASRWRSSSPAWDRASRPEVTMGDPACLRSSWPAPWSTLRFRAATRLPGPAAGRRRHRPGPSDRRRARSCCGAAEAAPGAARRGAGGGPAAHRRLAGGLPGVRRQTAAHPQQPGGATASRRAGLPRVNRLTDVYNAISVLHQVPLGGEDLSRYAGSPRLLRATGTEPFDTAADGAVRRASRARRGGLVRRRRRDLPTLELAAGPPHPAHRPHHLRAVHPRRPRPHDRRALVAAADDLVGHLQHLGPDVQVATRLIADSQR